jgi:ribosomal protein S18 acetylase RimI-like enzyme
MTEAEAMEIVAVTPALMDTRRDGLGRLLAACVAANASVGFLAPLAADEARAFWRKVGERVGNGEVAGWLALAGREVAGCVFLIVALPPNQPHRAEVMKLLVDPARRRQGIGQALMERVEAAARERGKTLLTLDTIENDAGVRLYRRLGFQTAGVVPGYAMAGDGRLRGTVFMYKALA